MPTEKRVPVIMLNSDIMRGTFSGDGDCLRFELSVLYVNEAGELRNYLDSSGISRHEDAYADLFVSAQADRSSDEPYGWRVEYRNVYSVDATRAELMLKTLRRVNRKLDKMTAELGYPDTFAAYVARVAVALGVKRFYWRHGDRPPMMYSDGDYGHGDANQMAYKLRETVKNFREPAGANA